jgi:hypothetical protein
MTSVLGKKELRQLLKWREALRKTWQEKSQTSQPEPEDDGSRQSENVCYAGVNIWCA